MTEISIKRPLKILLADDGSRHAEAAVQLLKDLPFQSDSNIYALTVFTPRQISEHERLRCHLEDTQKMLSGKNIAVSYELILGYPAEKIVEYSANIKPDLIVMGAKGLRATMGILLGGVAQQVVEYADYPVLIVRAPYRGIQKALLVTDGSRYSDSAVEYISNLPLPQNSEILVMHVVPPLPSYMPIAQTWPIGPEVFEPVSADWKENIETWRTEDEEKGQAIINRTVNNLKKSGIKADGLLRRGDAATEIITYIKQYPVDLIVAGSRGLSSIRGWLLGSVSRKLIHYADCSVLVVKDIFEE